MKPLPSLCEAETLHSLLSPASPLAPAAGRDGILLTCCQAAVPAGKARASWKDHVHWHFMLRLLGRYKT